MASFNSEWPRNFGGMDSSNSHVYDGLLNGVLQDQISQSRLELDVSALRNPYNWLDQEWPVSAIDLPTKGLASQSVWSTSQESMTSGGEEFSGFGSNDDSSSSRQIDLLDVGRRNLKGITMPTHDKAAN